MEEREQVRRISANYAERTETDTDRLRKLDKKVSLPAKIFAAVFGAAGTLVLGTGMCLSLGVIGNLMPLGIVVGLAGIVAVSANYFIYSAILKARRKKYAVEVLALSNKILAER